MNDRCITTPTFREKQIRLVDGRNDLLHHIYMLNNFVHGEAIADWLLKRGLKGALLKEWLLSEFQDSVLEMVKHVVKDVNRARTTKPIIVGEDYRGKRFY